ncbi:hypothetical protein [Mesorhizobium sophorae]|uniref:hypothetical protein n=1 Tax=Mesorhizobium sophorae TaxID=1300294 RepID=UPI000BA43F11|nr:hypothetical protein [Mesorhizobium sophorae]
MAEYMHLIGAEEVRSAGNAMSGAASEMRGAASSIDSAFERHHRFLDDWLQRFEAAMERAERGFGYAMRARKGAGLHHG